MSDTRKMLWGYHPDYQFTPIKLCFYSKRDEKQRTKEGWIVEPYPVGKMPHALNDKAYKHWESLQYTTESTTGPSWSGASFTPDPAGHYVLCPSGERIGCPSPRAAQRLAADLNSGKTDESEARAVMLALFELVA